MSINLDMVYAIQKIDQYYSSKCNGEWEHYLGISMETTDNPGWLVKFDDLPMDNKTLSSLVEKLLLHLNSQVSSDGTIVRLFAPTLRECILSSAILIDEVQKRRN